MPGMMIRPRNEVHVVRQPIGVHPEVMPKTDGRDKILFSREDQEYFHIDRILGSGGFGVAAKVRVLKTDSKFRRGETIVVKQLRSDSERDRKAFREEYNIGRQLGSHENIVEVFAMTVDNVDGSGRKCDRLFMKYCNAGTLYQLIKDHKAAHSFMPEAFVWYVLASMGYALARLHNGLRRENLTRSSNWTGYTHYDIKSDNVLLNWSHNPSRLKNPYPTPKLADFGCSGRIGRRPDFVGHAFHRAPELVADAFQPCLPEADIFSLGVMMYEMCELQMPFGITKDRRGDEILDFRSYRPMKSNYHPRLKKIIEQCLCLDYRKRPGAEDLFLMCRRFKDDISATGWKPWGARNLRLIKPN